MKVGDIVCGAHDNPTPSQRNSVAIVVNKEWDNRFTIMWILGQITRRAICRGLRQNEYAVTSEGR